MPPIPALGASATNRDLPQGSLDDSPIEIDVRFKIHDALTPVNGKSWLVGKTGRNPRLFHIRRIRPRMLPTHEHTTSGNCEANIEWIVRFALALQQFLQLHISLRAVTWLRRIVIRRHPPPHRRHLPTHTPAAATESVVRQAGITTGRARRTGVSVGCSVGGLGGCAARVSESSGRSVG